MNSDLTDAQIEPTQTTALDCSPVPETSGAQSQAQRLDAILNATNDHIYVLDRTGRVLDASLAAAQAFGMDRSEIIGKTGAEIGVPPEVLDRTHADLDTTFSTGTSLSAEMRYPSEEGDRYFAYTWNPMPNADGTVETVLLTLRDITEHTRAEAALRESERKYRSIVDTTSEGIWAVDVNFRTTFVNHQMTEMLGYTEEEMLGCSVLDFLFPEDRTRMEQRFAERRQGRTGQYDARYRCKNGSELWVLSHTAPQWDEQGRFISAIGTFSDITQRKRTEQERAAHLLEIEALNKRLQRAMRETDHRVKNNLQVIMALLNMETMRHEQVVPTEDIRQISQHAQALVVIHEILIQQAKTDAFVQELSARTVMTRLLVILQGIAASRTLRYTIAETQLSIPQCRALAVLLNELISNAVRHGTGDIVVSFDITEGKARMEVTDEGPGFPEDFNPKDAAYTGIELIQSLALWDLGGDIRFESRPEGGARVVIEFPLRPRPD